VQALPGDAAIAGVGMSPHAAATRLATPIRFTEIECM